MFLPLLLRLRSARATWMITLLVALLQKTPILRVLASAEFFAGARTGQMLRALIPVAAAAATTHALTGATQFTSTPASPASGTVGQQFNLVFSVTGAPTPTLSYAINGTLPPGLSVPNSVAGPGNSRTLNAQFGTITGVPTQAGTFNLTIQAWDQLNRTGNTDSVLYPVQINITGGSAPPAFTTHPSSTTVNFGSEASFSVAVSGSPAPTLQWRKDNVAIAGQTGTSLTISNTQLTDAGAYDVVATNTSGSVTSNAATLTVTPPAAPSITVQPFSMSSRIGSAAFFSVQASGSFLSYQWRKGGVDIAGATSSSLYISNVQASDAGSYAVQVSNPGNAVVSDVVTLATPATGSVRVVNLSTRARVGINDNVLIPGFVIGGSGAKNLLVRAVGPGLAAQGVTSGFLADPFMDLRPPGQPSLQSNDNWQQAPNQSGMETVRAAVGAFPLTSGSTDASLLLNLAGGVYTVVASGVSQTTGVGLVELYDADPPSSPARLVNISARAQVGTGADILIPGFVIEGDVALTVLIRGVGPFLTTRHGLSGTLADPQMTLFRVVNNGSVVIGANDDWQQAPNLAALVAASSATGAEAFTSGSTDAAMLVALSPGIYTVHMSGKNGGTGVGLVELYILGP